MAIRFARQAGNWSDPLTWDDGLTIPTTGDEVYLNNYNITIDQNVTTGFISNSQTPIGVPLDPIPDMTSNTSPVGVGQAFATQNSVTAWKVFRKGLNTFSPSADQWVGAINGGQIGYQFDTPKSIQRYAWYQNSGAGSRPKDWTFQGSNDGVTWVTLHTVVAAASSAAYNSPNISNPSSYTYYRINVTAVQLTGYTLWLNALSMTESTSFGNGYLSGGTATISTSRTVNADLYHNTGTLITISATSPSVVNINGNMPGTSATGNNFRAILLSGSATVNYTGNIIASTDPSAQTCRGIEITGSGSVLNVTGDVAVGLGPGYSNIGQGTHGIYASAPCTVNIVGNLSGPTRAAATFCFALVIANSGVFANITGNVNGIGGTTTLTQQNGGIHLSNVTGTLTTIGALIASNSSSAISGLASNVNILHSGTIQNAANGFMAVVAPFFFNQSVTQWEFRKADLTTNTLYTPGVATGHPAEANVRLGTVYGPTNNLIGTCAVPPAAAVGVGVPVDNTVGIAQLTAEDFLNGINSSVNPIAERIKNSSTVQTTGAQLSSFLS